MLSWDYFVSLTHFVSIKQNKNKNGNSLYPWPGHCFIPRASKSPPFLSTAVTGRWAAESIVPSLHILHPQQSVSWGFGCPSELFYIWEEYLSHYIKITLSFINMSLIMTTSLILLCCFLMLFNNLCPFIFSFLIGPLPRWLPGTSGTKLWQWMKYSNCYEPAMELM